MFKVSVRVVSIVHVSATSARVNDSFSPGQMYLRSHLERRLDHPQSAAVFFSVFPLPLTLSPYAAVACSPHFSDSLLSGHCATDSPVSWCFHPQLGPMVLHFGQYFHVTW